MTTALSHDVRAQRLLDLLGEVIDPDGPAFEIALWDGTVLPSPDERPPRFTLRIRSPAAVAALAHGASGEFGSAFAEGLIDIEGDLLAAVEAGRRLRPVRLNPLARAWLALADRVNGLVRRRDDRADIGFHYDHPVEFWTLWLDPYLQYSCAYFPEPTADLATAQAAKLEYVCRKLGVESGDRVLDIGCGWGGFLRYAARTRRARVAGVTLSRTQAAHARAAVAEAGPASGCEVRESHFRDLPGGETFDRVAGIGIFEHLGTRQAGEYFRTAFRALRPGGTFLNQAIACAPEIESFAGTAFIDRFVFPGAELIPVSAAVAGAEAVGFEVLDVEELRGHYERTLALWRERLEANRERAEAVVGAGTVRAFRLYFAAFQREFEAGSLRLYQVLLRKPDRAGTRPITRAAWYAPR